MKIALVIFSMFISCMILVFNGTFGYFFLLAKFGAPKGVYYFLGLSILAIIMAIIPVLMKYPAFRFYFRVFLYTNILVAFYPFYYKIIAEQIIARLL